MVPEVPFSGLILIYLSPKSKCNGIVLAFIGVDVAGEMVGIWGWAVCLENPHIFFSEAHGCGSSGLGGGQVIKRLATRTRVFLTCPFLFANGIVRTSGRSIFVWRRKG